MAFRFVRSAGSVHEPAAVELYASGVVRPGMAVEFSRTSGVGVIPGSAGTRTTSLFGVCLDYVQGASDVRVRVIPFVPGQIWEADCVSAASTAHIGFKHQLYAGGSLINNTGYDLTATQGVFLQYDITGATTGSGKILGEFVRTPAGVQQAGIAGDVYF